MQLLPRYERFGLFSFPMEYSRRAEIEIKNRHFLWYQILFIGLPLTVLGNWRPENSPISFFLQKIVCYKKPSDFNFLPGPGKQLEIESPYPVVGWTSDILKPCVLLLTRQSHQTKWTKCWELSFCTTHGFTEMNEVAQTKNSSTELCFDSLLSTITPRLLPGQGGSKPKG